MPPTLASFLDIDQTLMFSSTALTRLGVPRADLQVAESIAGRPSGFVHADLPARLKALSAVALVVPTTTRSTAQFLRVQLFSPEVAATAIVANGAVILVDGEPDRDWADRVATCVRSSCLPLSELAPTIDRLSSEQPEKLGGETPPGRVYIVDNTFFCIVFDNLPRAEVMEHAVAIVLGDTNWSVSRQSRKVYVIPEPVSKSAAAAEVQRRYGTGVATAAGDSVLDIDLLRAVDLAIAPRHSASLAAICVDPAVVVTDATGPVASIEIIERMLAFSETIGCGTEALTLQEDR